MSWSLSCIGKPEKVAEAIEKYGEQLGGQCKIEFDAAKPHLLALVKENFTTPGSYSEPVLDFEAYGSGCASGDKQIQRDCSVILKRLNKTLV